MSTQNNLIKDSSVSIQDLYPKGSSGQFLQMSGSQVVWGAGGGGSSITVKDEGITLTTALASLNFVGSGVTATAVGNDVTVTVLGGGTPAGSTGAVQFNDGGSFGADTSNFFWDDTNKRLGIGTSSPGDAKIHVLTTVAGNSMLFESTDSGSEGPAFVFKHTSISPAINDTVGGILFNGRSAIPSDVNYAVISGLIGSTTAGNHTGKLWFSIALAGSTTSALKLQPTENVFNDDANNIDFRIEGQANSNLFFIDASTDRVGVGTNTPNSNMHVVGSTTHTLTARSADTTLDATHYTVTVDASGAARTITLPAISGITGRIYKIKKIDSSANTVTIDGNASETIDGATTYVIENQYDYVTIQAGASEWHIIG